MECSRSELRKSIHANHSVMPEPGTQWEIKNNLSTIKMRLVTNGPINGSVGATAAIVGGRGEGKPLVLNILNLFTEAVICKHCPFLSLIPIKTICQKFIKGRKFIIIIRW